MAGVVQQCAQDANAQIEAANGQISGRQQIEAANAVITNASATLQATQGQADENGMISAESLSAVIGSLAGADAGVSGVSGIDADAYTGQAQQIAAFRTDRRSTEYVKQYSIAAGAGSFRFEQWSRHLETKV